VNPPEPQPEPDAGIPEESLPQEANVENNLDVSSDSHLGQFIGFELDEDLNISNFSSQLSHLYSKIGINFHLRFQTITLFLSSSISVSILFSIFCFLFSPAGRLQAPDAHVRIPNFGNR